MRRRSPFEPFADAAQGRLRAALERTVHVAATIRRPPSPSHPDVRTESLRTAFAVLATLVPDVLAVLFTVPGPMLSLPRLLS